MNLRRLLATAAAVSVLSGFGPHSSGVWAQDNVTMAVCHPGWEWVRFFKSALSRTGFLEH